ncbi:MAG TPA: TrpR like protein, YerC/YecD [Rhodospirillaceae bacterium]|nr:TrpR like protein, YerC/YecD [Rhodospirillaceae bacterium]
MSQEPSKDETALYEAIGMLETPDEIKRFMADLCTPGEVKAFTERWAIAKLLDKGEDGYREIAAATSASTTTVARVARFLKQEHYQGYRLILDRLKSR